MARKSVTSHKPHCVVQLGFAGSRRLRDVERRPVGERDVFHDMVRNYLVNRLQTLREDLGLSSSHFFCGISQIAIGADTLFTRACQELRIPQRIFLPHSTHVYLTATGSHNEPDFLDEEREAAERLLKSPHIIQERIVSDAQERDIRFEDANLEILRVSDVVVCLIRAGSVGKPGGTTNLLERAKKRRTPVLEIQVFEEHGEPVFEEAWYNLEEFRRPHLPQELSSVQAPLASDPSKLAIGEYCDALKSTGSSQANWQRRVFRSAAAAIVGTHSGATVLATGALLSHEFDSHVAKFIAILLSGFELLSLFVGFLVHRYLHHSEAAKVWALSRVSAEIARSIQAMPDVHVYLRHLFELPLPEELRPLLRTLSVLHLQSTRNRSERTWQEKRDAYAARRLRDSKSGQIHYYTTRLKDARLWLKRAQRTFFWCSLTAIVATFIEFVMAVVHYQSQDKPVSPDLLSIVLGGLAIGLPVFAVGALSLAAALDLEARVHTYKEMLQFLKEQAPHLDQADSEQEFKRLLLETERRLLGETTAWYSRRSFTGVA